MQKSANQMHTIWRLQNPMGKKEKVILENSFFYSNFDNCPFTWNFCFGKLMEKIEKIQERCLQMLPTLAIEIFRTLND